jgi:hypothetical protein
MDIRLVACRNEGSDVAEFALLQGLLEDNGYDRIAGGGATQKLALECWEKNLERAAYDGSCVSGVWAKYSSPPAGDNDYGAIVYERH